MRREPVPVEVRPAVAPDGDEMVLLQLPDGFTLMTPESARRIAAMLLNVADEVDEDEDG